MSLEVELFNYMTGLEGDSFHGNVVFLGKVVQAGVLDGARVMILVHDNTGY